MEVPLAKPSEVLRLVLDFSHARCAALPNWCLDCLDVVGPPQSVDAFATAVADPDASDEDARIMSFGRLVPMPSKIARSKDQEAWLGWTRANWGTKWNPDAVEVADKAAGPGARRLRYIFSTAWNAPLPFLDTVARRFLDLEFDLFYGEEGNCFAGRIRWLRGIQVQSEEASDPETCHALAVECGFPEMFTNDDSDEEPAVVGP